MAPALIAGSLVYAYLNRFIQDDAFISFVYARNWVEGNGLTWCTGERVEGYSNFLWVLIAAVGEMFHWNIIHYVYLVGFCLFAASMLIWHRVSVHYFADSKNLQLAFLLALSANHSWTAHATGGLETPLVTFLFAVLFMITVCTTSRNWTLSRLALYSFVLALGVLTRMDFALLAFPSFSYIFFHLVANRRSRSPILSLIGLFIPAAILLGGALLARYLYYGTFVPNSYWLKFAVEPNVLRVAIYFSLFFAVTQLYFLFPALPYCLWRHREKIVVLSATSVLLWLIYIAKIGGDFMEFRLLVPILPIMYILVLRALSDLYRYRRWTSRIAFVLLLAIAPSIHHLSDLYVSRPAVSTTSSLQGTLADPYGWIPVGKMLEGILPSDTRIGVIAAGAITYYSKLYTVDMLGLSDLHIRRNGILLVTSTAGIKPDHRFGVRPGHGRLGRYSYAQQQNLNFLVMHPRVILGGERRQLLAAILHETQTISFWREFLHEAWHANDSLTFVLLPIKDRYLITLYCFQDSKLDQLIMERHYPRFNIRKEEWLSPFEFNRS